MDLQEITTKLDELNTRTQELLATAEGDNSKAAEVKALIDTDIAPEIERLKGDRQTAEQREEFKAVQESLGNLNSVIEELRKPSGAFKVSSPGTIGGKGLEDVDDPYADGAHSPYTDIYMAKRGNPEARERLTYGAKAMVESGRADKLSPEGKAMSEGVSAQGGYLVQPLLERQLVLAREKDNVIRGLASSLTVETNEIQLDQLGLATTAGWVAELATKPETTSMTLATVSAKVYTAAGLATISNQLLQDSNPSIDQLVTQDLAKRIVALEETAFLVGTGTGQPLGILETPSVPVQAITETTDPAASKSILDKVLDGIAEVQQNWGQPSAIVMHPRTWTAILKSRDSAGHYTIAPRNIIGAGYDPETARTYIQGPQQTLFGIEVVLSNRIPTNLGGGTNESRIIIGDFKEALVLDRQGITVDESEHVLFTSNATVFRAEARVGFTAARQPLAFTVVGGAGLATR